MSRSGSTSSTVDRSQLVPLLQEESDRALERLADPSSVIYGGEDGRVCDECGHRISVGSEGTEYGHVRRPRCSRRSDDVDPVRYR